MSDAHYSKFDSEALILRDYLAIDRTVLANERTVLAYTRTALTLLVIGATLFHLFDWWLFQVAGFIFGALGALIFVIGIVQFIRVKQKLSKIHIAPQAVPPC